MVTPFLVPTESVISRAASLSYPAAHMALEQRVPPQTLTDLDASTCAIQPENAGAARTSCGSRGPHKTNLVPTNAIECTCIPQTCAGRGTRFR